MNRNLLVFSVLLILLGVGVGEYLLYLIGFFLLFPALLLTPGQRPKGTPTGLGQQPIRRASPKPASPMEMGSTPAPSQTVAATSVPPTQASQFAYSPSLFPASMFPSASQPTQTSMFPSASQTSQPAQAANATKETRPDVPASRDEVLELGALLVLAKLVFG